MDRTCERRPTATLFIATEYGALPSVNIVETLMP
jgi:hypothetical protein